MNSVCLIGRITKDIELRTTPGGNKCVSMYLAVNNGKDKDGNERPADFPKIYVWDNQAETLYKYCKKGSLISIMGRLKTRSWDKEDGSKGYETYVYANRVQFLNTKSSEGVPLPEPEYANSELTTTEKSAFEEFGKEVDLSELDKNEVVIDSSDLPF